MHRSRFKEALFLSKVKSGEIEVSKSGEITHQGKPISTHGNNRGYKLARVSHNKKRYSIMYHCLVWSAFNGPIPDGKEINHIDGDKHNNDLSNLELIDRGGNIGHAWANGLRQPARGRRILQPDIDRALFLKNVKGKNYKEIAEILGFSKSGIYQAVYAHENGYASNRKK